MPTDKKTIDAYNKYAEKWVGYKRGGTAIFHTYLEKPAMYSKVPQIKGKTVLCIGCGSAEEVEHISSLGAKRTVGIDISEKQIDTAKKSYPKAEFYVMDIEKLDFPKNSFDFAYSSLTMHYLENWVKALRGINNVLKQAGIFVFSITHPFFSATKRKDGEKEKLRILGYKDIKLANTWEIYGNYFGSYSIQYSALAEDMVVTNYHRPLSAIIKDITKTGFEILDIVEPKALDESKKRYKKFWEIHRRIPEFMILELRKNKSA